MVSICLNVPADDGIHMGELGLDEHLDVKDDGYDDGYDERQRHRHDDDDDDGTDMSELENMMIPV